MKLTLRGIAFLSLSIYFSTSVHSQENSPQQPKLPLTHQMTPDEYSRRNEIGRNFVQTDPPSGEITSMAEFDRAIGPVISYAGVFGIPMNLIREMAKDAIVTTLVPDAATETMIRGQYQQARINLDNCRFMHIPTNSYWTRDFGPMYVTYGSNQIGIVDFPYNRPRPEDDDAPHLMAEELGIEWFGMPVTHTGGNYMSDGYGFASSTTIAYTENPDLTPTQVNTYMQDYLGIDDYSVLEDPNNTYIDHIDCWGKYLGPDKVLIRSVPTTHPQYNAIEATAAYYANKISIYGTPYKVYRVYTPQNQPYSNSYILNDKVFVPIMNSQYDEQALETYRNAMPGYKVFGFLGKSDTPWESTDALHCRAHEMADLGMLYLKHIPIQGNAPVQSSYTFTAYVKPFGGQQVYADSVLLYYRVNPNPSTPYTAIHMTNSMGNAWTASLTAPDEGSTVEYYIYAADDSGKREYQPFIGPADAFKFYVGSQMNAQVAVSPLTLDITAMKDTQSSTPLTIDNTGQTGLNYSLSLTTDINDTLSFNLNNSPSATSYNSNTLTESGWTNFAVTTDAQVSNLVINYQWDTDEFYTEGSLWIQSPAGTIFKAGQSQLDGFYKIVCPAFTGESMNGTWKVWIEDTHGDGGHQATNVHVKIVKADPAGNWLSVDSNTGVVPAGESAQIQVTGNAQGMALGTYEGRLTIWSNDPNQQSIDIPVTFHVTINISSKPQDLLANHVNVNPNPFNDQLSITFSLIQASNLTFELYNTQGTCIYKTDKSLTAGDQNINIPTTQLSKGMYLLKLTNGLKSETFKLIK